MSASAGLGYLEQGALTTPLTPANGFGRWYIKEVATVTTPFFIGDDGTEIDLTAGGGSQTPWTSNIDAATFDLNNLGGLELNNPADTFQYIFSMAAIIADRTISLPLLAASDTFVFEAFAQTLTNKTLTTPTIASFVNATHTHLNAAGGGTITNAAISDFAAGVSGNAAVVLNTAKITNANHTGDATGATALTLQSIAITGQSTVSAASGDFVLISDTGDSGNLKKVDALDFLGGTTLPVVDTTSIVEGSGDATKELRFEVDGNTTGIIGVIATIFTTAKTVTIPDATDTLVGKATTDILTNKSIDANGTGNVITNIGDAETETFTTTKISTLNKALLNSAIVYDDQVNVFGDFAQTFQDNQFFIRNPADTFSYRFVAGAITVANRDILLPVLIGNDTMVMEAFAATLTNKTINTASNTITVVAADMTDYASATAIFTNKTIDADGTGNVITNIGSSEIKSEIITGFSTVTALSGDFILISDTSDSGNLKKVDALDFLGGASQTPWVADIDAADFSLNNLDKLEFNNNVDTPVITQAEIYFNTATTGMNFNVPTGDEFTWRVNGTIQMNFAGGAGGLDLNDNGFVDVGNMSMASGRHITLSATSQLRWGSGESIGIESGDMVFDIPTTDNFQYHVATVLEWTFDAVQLLGAANNNIELTGTGFLQMDEQAGDPSAGTTSGKYYVKQVGGIARPFFIGDGLAATDLTAAAGGEFTGAWTADHNQTGSAFSLQDARFADPTDNTKTIQMDLSGMTTAIELTIASNQTTAQTLTIPNITTADVIVTENFAQTLAGKTLTTPTIASFTNATHDHQAAAGGGTLLSTSALSDTADIAYLNQVNVFGDFANTFQDNQLFIRNPANTFSYQFVAAAITVANRVITLPLLTGNDTLVTEAFAQTLTNKTIDGDLNTIIDINETQMNVSVGAASTVLTSNGVGAAPTYQTAAGGEFTGAWTANHNNGGSTFALEDALFADPTDDTKQLQMDLAGMTTGIIAILDFNFTTAKTITFPDATGTVVVTGLASQITIGTEVTGASTALTDTADIAYLNTANTFIAGNKNTFAHSATTAGLAVLPVAGNPSGQADGDIWLNVSTQQLFARINGADVDLGAGAGGEIFTWTADHSTGGFSLLFTTATQPAGTVRYISYNDTITGINYNALTGDEHTWRINDTIEMKLDSVLGLTLSSGVDLRMSTGTRIQWGGSSNRRIRNDTAGFIFEVETGDNYQYQIQNTVEFVLDVNKIDIDAKYIEIESIASPGVTGFATTGRIFMDSGNSNILSIIRNGAVISLEASGSEVFTWTADHDTGGFSLLFTDDASPPAGTVRSFQGQNTDEIHMNVPAAGQFDFNVNDIAEMVIDGTNVTLATNDLILSGIGAFVQMEEEAADPAAGTTSGKYYVKEVGGIARPFFIGDGLGATDLSTGTPGEFTAAWTANHNQGGSAFSLEDARFADPTDDTKTIQLNLAGMTTAIELTLSTSQSTAQTLTIPNITAADNLVTDNVAATLTNKTHDATNVFTAATGLTNFTGLGTQAQNLVMNGNSVNLGAAGTIFFSAADTAISEQAGSMFFDVPTTELFSFDIAGVPEYSMDATQLLMNNNILNMGDGILRFTNAGQTIVNSAGILLYDVADTFSHDFRVNDIVEASISGSALTLATNNLVLTAGFLQFSDVNTTITDATGILQYDVASTFSHDFRINNTVEAQLTNLIFNLPNAAFQEAGIPISPIGIHDMYWDGGSFISITAGAKAETIIGTGDNRKGVLAIPFANGATEFATIKIIPPRNYDNSTITVVVHSTPTVTGTGNVIWGIAAVAAGDGDDLTAAATDYGTEITVTDAQTTLSLEELSTRTAAITPGNTPADGDAMYIRVQRRGGDGGDTFSQPVILLGISVAFNTNAAVAA